VYLVKLYLPDWTGDGRYYVTMLKAAAVCVMQILRELQLDVK